MAFKLNSIRRWLNELPRIEQFQSRFAPTPETPRVVYAASMAINLLALALPLTILQVYDRVLPHAAFTTLNALLFGLIGVIFIDIILKHSRSLVSNWLGAAYAHNTSTKALSSILKAEPDRHIATAVASHLDRLSSISAVGDHLASPARVVKIDILFVPIFALVIFFVGGPLLLVPITLFALFGYFSFIRTRRLHETIKEREQTEARKNDFVIEALSAIATVKSHAMEPSLMRRFERLQLASSEIVRRTILLTSAAQAFASAFAALSTVSIIGFGAFLVIDGRLTVGSLACCMLLSSQLVQPLTKIMSSWNELQLAAHNQQKTDAIFEENKARPADARRAESGEIPSPASIIIRDATIKYGDAKPLFENLSLDILPGQLIAIRGGDGSGKSSLLRLLTGSLIPNKGTVRIGNTISSKSTRHDIRKAVRYVGQEAAIFQGTILDNLTVYGKTAIASAIEASVLVGLDKEIVRMPMGYDTRIENISGRDIPASTAQRISIARSIALRPSVLILDEANAALDIAGEKALVDALRALHGKMTIVLATHRPSLIRMADAAYEIADRIVAPIDLRQAQKAIAS